MPKTTEIAKEILENVNQNGVAKKDAIPKIEQIRSDEVQEIISAVPSWMIRWGITFIFALIVMLIGLSWFIKYPDIIFGNTTLTTIEPPVKLVVKNAGQLTRLLIADGTTVEKNQVIAEMENPLTQEGIGFLNNYLLEIRDYLSNKELELPTTN
jgi:multidrug efflux pump subunit AcrA (membrane-fusion protein)